MALFDGEDPFAQHRPLDDKRYALDYFQTKLLKLPQTMQTVRGKAVAICGAFFSRVYGEAQCRTGGE